MKNEEYYLRIIQELNEQLQDRDRAIEIYLYQIELLEKQTDFLKELAMNLSQRSTIINSKTIHAETMSDQSSSETRNVSFNAPIQGAGYVEGDNYYYAALEQKQSLAEAAAEIQQLLDQLSQTYSPAEAEQKVAEDLANKAKQDPSFKEKLKGWSQSLFTKGSETAITETVKEGVKRVIPLAISLLI